MEFDPKKGIRRDFRLNGGNKGLEMQLIQYDIKDGIVSGKLMITNTW